MIALDVAEAARAVGGELRGPEVEFRGVATDSRNIQGAPLFVAIRGQHHDGHEFAAGAAQAGAAGLLVERWLELEAPQICCPDSLLAVGRLAAHWRSKHQPRVVGITGSNGKTTVKSMLAAIVGTDNAALVNEGNFNNELGLPLTLCRLDSEHKFAILEMGAARPGDIRYLAQIARPQIGVINNAGPAHLEGMGDVAGVARTKGELISELPEDGLAIFNGDDEYAAVWQKLAGSRRVVRFGLQPANEVTASWAATDDGLEMTLRSDAGDIEVGLACHGQHNVYNALAAAAAGLALDLSLQQIGEGLARFRPVDGRLQERIMAGGWRLLADTYNANPASVSAGLRVLAGFPGERWLVLGDMRELGPDSDALHFQIGAEARRLGIERLFCLGERTRHTADGFGDLSAHHDDLDQLVSALRAQCNPGVTCLVKGSRGMRMERVVSALEAN